jgi:Flp pilus assembly protein TadD
MLLEQARADVARGNLVSAETSLRLALTFSPDDPQAAAELRAVLDLRDRARREAGLRVR